MGTKIKMLIADDEEIICSGMKTYLELNAPYIDKIYTAYDGKQAIDLIFRHKPDVLIIDVQMPYYTGLEVIHEIQKAGLYPKTIILSGHDEFKYAQQAIRYGAREYLLKPCRAKDLLKKINLLIDWKEDQGNDEEHNNALVNVAKEYITEHYMEPITLTGVAEQVQVTSAYLSTLFSKTMDIGFVEYLNQIRIDRACTYLCDSKLKTYEVAYKVGFNDEKYFARVFKKAMGMSPSQYRKEQA